MILSEKGPRDISTKLYAKHSWRVMRRDKSWLHDRIFLEDQGELQRTQWIYTTGLPDQRLIQNEAAILQGSVQQKHYCSCSEWMNEVVRGSTERRAEDHGHTRRTVHVLATLSHLCLARDSCGNGKGYNWPQGGTAIPGGLPECVVYGSNLSI